MRLAYIASPRSAHTIRWANAMGEKGHEILLITIENPSFSLHPSVVLRKLPFRRPAGYWLNAPWVRHLLARFRPDLLHVHYAAGYGVLGRLSGFHPRILSIWGSDVFLVPYQSRFQHHVVRKNLFAYDILCATGPAIAEQTRRICPEVGEILITPFGVDLAQFVPNPSHRDPSVVTIGTVKGLHPVYGTDILVRAFAELHQRLHVSDPYLASRLRLLIVGRGTHRPQIEALVDKLGLASVTEMPGPVPHSEVPNWLNRLDIYVTASRSESFGVAVLEASACGIPVVVTNVGGLPEVVVDRTTGFIVPPENPSAIADALETLTRNPDLRQQMGSAGRQFVSSRYDWNDSVRIMEGVYAKAIALAANTKALHRL
ncbi:MAG: glycosyltransferase [Armatimonadota bacterium]